MWLLLVVSFLDSDAAEQLRSLGRVDGPCTPCLEVELLLAPSRILAARRLGGSHCRWASEIRNPTNMTASSTQSIMRAESLQDQTRSVPRENLDATVCLQASRQNHCLFKISLPPYHHHHAYRNLDRMSWTWDLVTHVKMAG